jgi:hypothetical protein
MDCFAPLAMTVATAHTFAISPRLRELWHQMFRPRIKKGRRECRALDAPAASHAK